MKSAQKLHDSFRRAGRPAEENRVRRGQRRQHLRRAAGNDAQVERVKSFGVPANEVERFVLHFNGINLAQRALTRAFDADAARPRANIPNDAVRFQMQRRHDERTHIPLRHRGFAANERLIRQTNRRQAALRRVVFDISHAERVIRRIRVIGLRPLVGIGEPFADKQPHIFQPAEVQALPHPRRIVRRVEKAKRLPMRPHSVAQRAFRKCSAMRGEDFRVLPRNAQPRGKELQGADARMHTQIFAADFPFEHFQQAVQSRVAGNQHGGTLSCVAG